MLYFHLLFGLFFLRFHPLPVYFSLHFLLRQELTQMERTAGYRLAAWLDLIATGETGLAKIKRDVSAKVDDYVFPPANWARRDNSAERQKHKRHAIGCTC